MPRTLLCPHRGTGSCRRHRGCLAFIEAAAAAAALLGEIVPLRQGRTGLGAQGGGAVSMRRPSH